MTTPNYKIQLATRVPIQIRERLDKHIDYMERNLDKRPPETEDWPMTIEAVIEEALTFFFAEHPLRPRRGPGEVARKQMSKRQKGIPK